MPELEYVVHQLYTICTCYIVAILYAISLDGPIARARSIGVSTSPVTLWHVIFNLFLTLYHPVECYMGLSP